MSPAGVGIRLASGWTYALYARDIYPVPLGLRAGTKAIPRLVTSGEGLKSNRSSGAATRSGQTMLVHRQPTLAKVTVQVLGRKSWQLVIQYSYPARVGLRIRKHRGFSTSQVSGQGFFSKGRIYKEELTARQRLSRRVPSGTSLDFSLDSLWNNNLLRQSQ